MSDDYNEREEAAIAAPYLKEIERLTAELAAANARIEDLQRRRVVYSPDAKAMSDRVEKLEAELAAANARAYEKTCECEFLRQELVKYVSYWRDRDLQEVTKERDAARTDLAAEREGRLKAELFAVNEKKAHGLTRADLAAARALLREARELLFGAEWRLPADTKLLARIDAALKDEGRT